MKFVSVWFLNFSNTKCISVCVLLEYVCQNTIFVDLSYCVCWKGTLIVRHKNAVQILFHFMRIDFENYRNVIRIGVKSYELSHKLISLSHPTIYLTFSNVFWINKLWFHKTNSMIHRFLHYTITPGHLRHLGTHDSFS